MIDGGNVVGKRESKMEGDDGLRTMECLRGRLLAERVASRVAKEDAEQMANKVIELENKFRIEMKSRNRAEKRLKFLLKKLESLNISYVSDESEHFSLDKSEISCVSSSTASSYTKQPNALSTNPINCDIGEIMKTTELTLVSDNSDQTVSETATSSQSHNSPSSEENLDSAACTDNAISENSNEPESTQSYHDSKADDHSLISSIEGKEISEENDQEWDDCANNSLALVRVDLPTTTQTIDPAITNASVKVVLDALRHAREKLQNSMERRHMVKVGSR